MVAPHIQAQTNGNRNAQRHLPSYKVLFWHISADNNDPAETYITPLQF